MTVNPKSASRLANGLLPSIIVFAGLLLTLWIQTYSRDHVLFSGDGGLKAMLAQQIAQQLSSLSLPLDISFNISAPNWGRGYLAARTVSIYAALCLPNWLAKIYHFSLYLSGGNGPFLCAFWRSRFIHRPFTLTVGHLAQIHPNQ